MQKKIWINSVNIIKWDPKKTIKLSQQIYQVF